MDYTEFAAKIKAKYPDYADMDDLELAQKIVSKYPEDYGDVVFDAVADTPPPSLSERYNAGFAQKDIPQPAGFDIGDVAEFVGREGPPIVGGILGGMAGATAGTAAAPGVGTVAGAAKGIFAGAAMGRALQNATAQAINTQAPGFAPQRTALEEVADPVIAGAGQALVPAAGAALRGLKEPAIKVGAQGMRALAGIPEKAGRAVLKDPSILLRAKPVEEAGEAYAKSVGGLKSGAEAARATLGRSHYSGEAIANKFDDFADQIAKETIDTQTALALRQRTMKAVEDLPFNQRDLRGVLSSNIRALDDLLEKRLPEWGGARAGYRESKIAEEFSSLLPLNKNLSPNVLRTTAAIAGGVKGIAEGKPWMALGLPMISPAVYGTALKGAAYAGKAMGAVPPGTYRIPAEALSRGSAATLADFYMRQGRTNP
jgi:hypothetical protein